MALLDRVSINGFRAARTVEIDTNAQLPAPDGTNKFVIYNMVHERGYPAQFGFNFAANNILLYPRLRSRTDQYRVTIASPGIGAIGITRIDAGRQVGPFRKVQHRQQQRQATCGSSGADCGC